MNLIEQRANGASIASIKYTIGNNLRAYRYGRAGTTEGNYQRYIYNRNTRKVLGLALARAIGEQDCTQAIDLLNDCHLKMGNATAFFDKVFEVEVVYCDHCSTLAYEDDTRTVDGEGYYCQSCLSAHYYWSNSEDRYVSEDYRDDDEASSIGGYHSSKRRLGKIPSSFDRKKSAVYLGMELEIEIREGDREEKAEHLLEHLSYYRDEANQSHLYALCENDGSLNHGFEMVTGWTGLDVHEKQLSFFKERFVGAKSHDTKTCGLHVHISKADMSVLHGTKIIEFINDPQNQSLIKAIARRDSSRWCAFKDKKGNTEWKKYAIKNFKSNKQTLLCNLNTDRYEAVNFQNKDTIEFRLFRGTLRFETIMACLQFTYATYFFCKSHSKANLTTEAFLQYLCEPRNLKDTQYLREYLDQKGIVRNDGLTLGAFSLVSIDAQKEVA